MTSETRKLILELATGAISKAEFQNKYPVAVEQNEHHVLDLIQRALLDRSAEDIECALLLGFSFGFSPDCGKVLCCLLEESWHRKHEDIADVLGDLKELRSVDPLYRATATRHEYLDFDDSTALAVKCVWALYKIGTHAAIEKLALIAESDEREEVRKSARDLLNRRA